MKEIKTIILFQQQRVWSSNLRVKECGEFDHFMFITMTESGPYFTNLMLDGVEDKNISKEKPPIRLC